MVFGVFVRSLNNLLSLENGKRAKTDENEAQISELKTFIVSSLSVIEKCFETLPFLVKL
jgi:hypothetical protein